VPNGGTHWYRLIASLDGTRVVFGPVVATASGEPVELVLGRPLPNPATGTARVDFALPQAAEVSLRVYDMLGRQVATLADGPLPAGRHQVTWDGAAGGPVIPAGLYSIRLVTPQGTRTERLIWLRR
jgi:hypothetical protein